MPTVTRNEDGSLMFKYKENGVLHRMGNPAVIVLNKEGNVILIQYYQHGKMYRDPNEGPVSMSFYKTGKPCCLGYHYDNRFVGIVHISWYPNGVISCNNFRICKHHYKNEYFYKTGQLRKREYIKKIKGKSVLHRKHGPALRMYDKNGNIIIKERWLNGKLL